MAVIGVRFSFYNTHDHALTSLAKARVSTLKSAPNATLGRLRAVLR